MEGVDAAYWRSILPDYISRLQKEMNDPDKLIHLHPNTDATNISLSELCQMKYKLLQDQLNLSSRELTTERFCWLKLLFLLFLRSKAEFQLFTNSITEAKQTCEYRKYVLTCHVNFKWHILGDFFGVIFQELEQVYALH